MAGSRGTLELGDIVGPVERLLRRFDLAAALEWASRLGYAARGLVYLGLGVIVMLAAIDVTPRAHGAKAMLAAWADWPLGLVLLTGIALGLTGFTAWRVLQAVFDADRQGTSPKAWAVRLGQAISGLIYGGLALSALELLDQFEDVGEADEEQSVHGMAATVLALPHGDLLLLASGVAMLGVGAGNIIQGMTQDFAKRLKCDDKVCRWVVPLAKVGYGARGLATLPAGLFLAASTKPNRPKATRPKATTPSTQEPNGCCSTACKAPPQLRASLLWASSPALIRNSPIGRVARPRAP
jgi:hypothetical protein